MIVGMIWAQAHGRAIGAGGTIPWHVPEDLALFKRVTLGHAVIMGRATWESLPKTYRPLPGRENIVVTHNPEFVADGARVATSIPHALKLARDDGYEQAWIIGGAQIYASALEYADGVVVTDLDLSVADADVFSPAVPLTWKVLASWPDRGWLASRSGVNYRFSAYAPAGSPFTDIEDPLKLESDIQRSEQL